MKKKKTYIRIGLLFGGVMFIISTMWDSYRRTPSLPIVADLLIWLLVGYFVGLVYWKLAGEKDGQRPPR